MSPTAPGCDHPTGCNEHVRHHIHHPTGSVAHQAWAQDLTLHVAAVYSNPYRWRRRQELFHAFRRHMATLPNVRLHVGEIAYGERPHEVTSPDCETDFQFRSPHVLWHKENLLNCVIQRFPPGWKYGAIIDGDVNFTRHDIALETIHMLQLHRWVQMFSTYTDLCHDHKPLRVQKSFAERFCSGELTQRVLDCARKGYCAGGLKSSGVGATGLAWAFNRQAFSDCGTLLETCILGSGDWHMAFGLAGVPDEHPQTPELLHCGKAYADMIKNWQSAAAHATNRNIGVVKGHAVHHWHGSKSRRGYGERWKILKAHDYNPHTDISRDHQGILQLARHKANLRDDIRRYFESRCEDGIDRMPADVHLAR